jgi:RNA exonuclease 4
VDEGNTSLTTHVAIDCEMVGVGPDGKGDALARCSVVNWHGGVLFDKFVRPLERVTDYRTEFSGVRRGLCCA